MVLNNISSYTPIIPTQQSSYANRSNSVSELKTVTETAVAQATMGWPSPTQNQVSEQSYGKANSYKNAARVEMTLQGELFNSMITAAMQNRSFPLQSMSVESTLYSAAATLGKDIRAIQAQDASASAVRRDQIQAYQRAAESNVTANNLASTYAGPQIDVSA